MSLGVEVGVLADLIENDPEGADWLRESFDSVNAVRLQNENLKDGEAESINGDVEAEGPLWIEKSVWLSLYEAARLSIEHKTAICFS